tara:strand:+ start:976 stop:1533 length:558 start_codon:yes stop_codon:yes gene_type:complete
MSELRTNRIIPRDGLPSGSAGGIIQVKQTVKTDTFSNNTQSFVEITGLNVVITPSRSDSKILVEWGVYFGAASSLGSGGLRLVRTIGGTANDTLFIGDQASGNANMVRATNWATHMNTSGNRQNTFMGGKFLDSPSTTSPVKYHMALAAGQGGGATVHINRPEGFNNTDSRATVPSSITVMEVSG